MLVVVALGGNALLRRGDRPDAEVQEHNVAVAVAALTPLANDNAMVIVHGNGPQVGVLALESAADRSLSHPYPLDSLGAETQGLIGYWLLQELENALPDRLVAALVTQTVVDPLDPAFRKPTKFVGAVYDRATAEKLAAGRGWSVAADGDGWRRVVASPPPIRIVEEPVIRLLLDAGAVVVCAGGGGVPVASEHSKLHGVEAVIDKDLSASLLAERLDADAFLVLTDVDGVYLGYGTGSARLVRDTTPLELRALHFPAGSMGPKVDAACRFVEHTGRVAGIGSLADAAIILTGKRGTLIRPDHKV